jgi:hypothetical protein
VALAIDASSPSAITNSTNTGASLTATTASFTPPANSLLVVVVAGDTVGTTTQAMSVTDNLGVHLTWTQQVVAAAGDSPAVGGQAAIFTAPVVTSAAMTVSATNTSSSTAGDSLAAQVFVITGGGTTPTVGAVAKKNQATAGTSIAQSYTATGTGSWGFGAVSDWNATGTMTAGGTGNTMVTASTFSGLISYGFARRTTADGVSGSATTITVNFAASSSANHLAMVEVLDPGGAAATPLPLLVMARAV